MKLIKSSGCERILDLHVDGDEVVGAFDEVYIAIGREAKIPGFRPGKVPRPILERHFSKTAQEQVVQRLIPKAYEKMLKEANLAPVGAPRIDEVKCVPPGPLTFRVSLDVRPAVAVRNYKGLKAKAAPVVVQESKVDKIIELFQKEHATLLSVAREAGSGDFLLCDFTCLSEGQVVEKKERVLLPLTPEVQFPGLVEGLMGMTAGSSKEIDSKFPDDFPKEPLRGKPCRLQVVLHEVKERKLPAVDDEFAKDCGPFQTLGELRDRIRKDLTQRMESQRKAGIEGQLFEELLKRTSFDLPGSVVEAQRQRLLERARGQIAGRGVAPQEMEAFEKNLQERLQKSAQDQVKLFYILERIADLETIQVVPEEIAASIEKLSQESGRPLEEVRRTVEERHLVDELLVEVREAKTIQFLVDHARVEEEKHS